jgi:repressor LexA
MAAARPAAVLISAPAMPGATAVIEVELGVFDGDLAIVDPEQPAHHGDLVAALLPSEHGDEDLATLKVFELRQGRAWLVAANPVYAPIPIDQAWVLGRVTTTIRRF